MEMKRSLHFAVICAILVGAASLAIVAAAFIWPQSVRRAILWQAPDAGAGLISRFWRPSNAEIVSQTNQAVVTVIASRKVKAVNGVPANDWSFYSENNIQRGTGTGFIIDPQGLIVTNEHVIKDADRIRIRLADGNERIAKVIGADKATDLALLKIDMTGLPILKLGDSDVILVGDPVLAIGNPLEYEHSATAGIISAKGRKVYNERPYEDFIQTDAAINRGNSGGPLLNLNGEVIGVNTVIRIDGRGISFAVPSNIVRRVVAQLRAYGFVPRGFLGLTPANITAEVRDGLGLGLVQGVLVADVTPDFPAAKIGIQPYDVITHFNGQAIKNTDDFFGFVANSLPQQQVELGVQRGTSQLIYHAVLEPRPDNELDRPVESRPDIQKTGSHLGFNVRENSPQTLQEMKITNLSESIDGGVIISEVDPLSPAADSRLTVGQIILEANRQPIRTLDDFQRVTRKLKDGSALVLRVTYPQQRNLRLIAIRIGEL